MTIMELVEASIKKENGSIIIDDLEIHSDAEKSDVYVMWSTPCGNCWYYPIIQIDDDDGNIILHRTGPDGYDLWLPWIESVFAEMGYLNSDDWWYIY